ncbi:hypothetical protein [Aquabacterium sp.]|uniref:hypothetical protein n=1 Tax=Aquabacterium sp. TaxID=1872578 RepID=UPI0035ADDE55
MTIRIYRFTALLSLLVAGLLGSSLANAHGGEDHGDESKIPAPATAVAPRASAQSDDFELVAVLNAGQPQGPRLSIFVDRFKTNEPVVGAKLEVDAGGQSVPIKEESPGIYVAQLAALSSVAPGAKLALTISVEAGDTSDLLTTPLDIPASATDGPAHAHSRAEFAVWIAGAAIAVAAVGLLFVRRRRQNKGAQ